MSKLFVIDIPQLIYAYGIPNVDFQKIYLVQSKHDSSREGNRPFKETEKIFREICDVMDVEGEIIYAGNLVSQSVVDYDDVLDIQVINRNPHLRMTSRNRILCAQVEHVNLVRPKFTRIWDFGLVKRWDLVRKLLLPTKIRTFYTLAPLAKKGLLFHEKSLDHNKISSVRKDLAFKLAQKNPELLHLQSLLAGKNVVFTILRAAHFGGNSKWNNSIFEISKELAAKCENSLVLVKNHPSDAEDYSTLLSTEGCDVLFLSGTSTRFIPLEILVEYAKSYQFVGIDSTVLVSLQHSVREKTVIVDLSGWKTSREIAYELGSIRTQFPHVRIQVKMDEIQ